MMVRAYVAMTVEPGKEAEVGQSLTKIPGIVEAALTYGFCDILLGVDVESIEALSSMVFGKLRKIEGVTHTQTIVVSEYLTQ